jgi:hypothetical protein
MFPGVNNFQDYQIDGGRIEAIKAQMALWAQTLNATIDTAATIAYASAEIGISFLPGGDVLFTAIEIATNKNLPELTEEQSIAIGMQAATSLIPFVPSFLKKAVNSQVGELISFVWKKEGLKFTRITAGVKDGERLAAKFVDEAYDQSFFHMDSWCFAAETIVHTCERMIPIESIEVGQNVKAFNFDSGSWICSKVQEVHRNLYSGNLYTVRTGESHFRATVGHPVFVVRGADLELRPWPRQLSLTAESHSFAFGRWVNTEDLLVGDVLIGVDGAEHAVSEITAINVIDEPVYNLTVEGHHSFAVGEQGLLVHNKTWCELAGESLGLTKKELVDLRQNVANAWGLKSIQSTHGHHIVHKVGAKTLTPVGKEANSKSMALLNGFGIETVVTKVKAEDLLNRKEVLDNLCIAPNFYVHSDPYTIKVNKMITESLRLQGLSGLLSKNLLGEWVMREVTEAEKSVGQMVIKNVLEEIRFKIHKGDKL